MFDHLVDDVLDLVVGQGIKDMPPLSAIAQYAGLAQKAKLV